MVDIMNDAFKDRTPQVLVPLEYKFLSSIMQRRSFETRCCLSKNLDCIYNILPIPFQNFRLGVVYTPTKEEFFAVQNRKNHDCYIPKLIQELYMFFVAKSLDPEISGLAEVLGRFLDEEESVEISVECTTKSII